MRESVKLLLLPFDPHLLKTATRAEESVMRRAWQQ